MYSKSEHHGQYMVYELTTIHTGQPGQSIVATMLTGKVIGEIRHAEAVERYAGPFIAAHTV